MGGRLDTNITPLPSVIILKYKLDPHTQFGNTLDYAFEKEHYQA
jgi:hypothetical protein